MVIRRKPDQEEKSKIKENFIKAGSEGEKQEKRTVILKVPVNVHKALNYYKIEHGSTISKYVSSLIVKDLEKKGFLE